MTEIKEWKEYIPPAVCVAGSVVLYLILTFFVPEQSLVSESGEIRRGSYGAGAQEYQVFVEGLMEEEVPVAVTVEAQVYTKEEAEAIFTEVMDSMEDRIRGDNPSLMEVRTDLKLPGDVSEYGVSLQWYSSNSELINSTGKLLGEVEGEEEVILSVGLSTEIIEKGGKNEKKTYSQNYEMPIRVLPPSRSADEQLLAEFGKELAKKDAEQLSEGSLKLPAAFQGHDLKYRTNEGGGYGAILLLGILAAALLASRKQSAERDRKKKRDRELEMDFADMLSKFVVLMGAGLTVRNVWERIVKDYEEAKEKGRLKERAVYEEMVWSCYQMKSGKPESEVYHEFGQRCRLPPYLKFCSLLDQNRRTGTKNLRQILQMEMAGAFEERKNLARRLGEEAGTKLLLPLFLMLGIVMVIVMVPAMMSMG